eukprot:1577313-Pleurochrysis_carterae.AAC.1
MAMAQTLSDLSELSRLLFDAKAKLTQIDEVRTSAHTVPPYWNSALNMRLAWAISPGCAMSASLSWAGTMAAGGEESDTSARPLFATFWA